MTRRRLASTKHRKPGGKPAMMPKAEYERRAAEYAAGATATILSKVMDERGIVGQGGGRMMTEARMKQLRDEFANAIFGALMFPRKCVEMTPDPEPDGHAGSAPTVSNPEEGQ